ncbi:MAG: STN domain-containing protein [Planctomycetes bacterium]|nr:STN domain-containing protein [Planctomycetota bacterium]
MPTRVPSVRRPWWCLVVALCLVVGSKPRAEAKPPDLPQPTDYEFAPGDNGQTKAMRMLVPQDLFEEEQVPQGLSPADRCAALRTITRCVLFGLNPLAPLTRADRCLEYDDTPCAPVLHLGDYDVGVGGLLRDASVVLCSGPFSPFHWQLQTIEAPAQPPDCAGEEDQDEDVEIVPLHGGTIIEKNAPKDGQEESSEPAPASSMGPGTSPAEKDFCPQTHQCPPEKTSSLPAAKGLPEQQRAWAVDQYLMLAQFFANAGLLGEACECYQRVCALCPGTCVAQEAMKRMQALCASMYQGTAKPAVGEEQETPNVCPAVERVEKKGENKTLPPNNFIENIEKLEKAGRLYEEAEALMHEGKVDEACGLYEQIRCLCPGHRYAEMAAERLGELQGLRTKPVEGIEEGQEAPSAGEVFEAMGNLISDCVDAFLAGCGASPCHPDPARRMEDLLNQSEDLRQIEAEWSRFWFTDQPSHKIYDRIHGITEAGSPTDKKASLEERLAMPISLNCKDASLVSLIDDLRAWRRINIVFDRKALEDEGISQDTKINIRVENVALKSALNLVLRQVGLTWKIQDEVVLITTPRVARAPLVRKIYSISDLVRADRSSRKCKNPATREAEEAAADEVIALIEDTIAPPSWVSVGGDCAIEYFSLGRALVVTQTPEVHEQIADMLAALHRHLKTDQQDDSEEASSVEPEPRRSLVNAGYDITDVLSTHDVNWDRKTDRTQVKPTTIPAEELIALIRDGVAPESWDIHGGRGAINYNPELKTLFIEQTPEVHEAIQELLDARRREIELHKKECERQAEENGKTGGTEQEAPEQPDRSCCPACTDCEEEQETAADAMKPNVCVDFDQNKEGALRLRLQLGRFCFRLDCNQQGHGCLILGLGIDSGDPVSEFFGTTLEGVFKAVDSVIKPDEKDQSEMD